MKRCLIIYKQLQTSTSRILITTSILSILLHTYVHTVLHLTQSQDYYYHGHSQPGNFNQGHFCSHVIPLSTKHLCHSVLISVVTMIVKPQSREHDDWIPPSQPTDVDWWMKTYVRSEKWEHDKLLYCIWDARRGETTKERCSSLGATSMFVTRGLWYRTDRTPPPTFRCRPPTTTTDIRASLEHGSSFLHRLRLDSFFLQGTTNLPFRKVDKALI